MRWIFVFLVAAGAAYVFYINLCNSLFHCGCQSLWAGRAAMCNVWMENVPHCPLCSHGAWGSTYPKYLIWAAQAGIALPPWKLKDLMRLGLGLAAFLVIAGAIGLLFAVSSGYPTFLFFHLS